MGYTLKGYVNEYLTTDSFYLKYSKNSTGLLKGESGATQAKSNHPSIIYQFVCNDKNCIANNLTGVLRNMHFLCFHPSVCPVTQQLYTCECKLYRMYTLHSQTLYFQKDQLTQTKYFIIQ